MLRLVPYVGYGLLHQWRCPSPRRAAKTSPWEIVSAPPVDGMTRGGAPGILRGHLPQSRDTVADVLDVPRGHDVDPAAHALICTTIRDLYRRGGRAGNSRSGRWSCIDEGPVGSGLQDRGTPAAHPDQDVCPQEDFFMTDRPLTLMAVHAHPDDEATGTGGVLARYAAEGIRTVLVTCTDGGCGDGPGGVKPGDPGHDPAAVALLRRQELEASCDVLKISDLEMLDYADSGMMGWPSNDAPGSFWQTPVQEGAARLADLMRQYRPDVVVTYDENGFYGHPDHIQAHRITMAALEMTALTPKVYWTTMPRSMMQRFGEIMREFHEDMPEPDPAEAAALAEIGLPDDEITTWVDTTAFSGQKFDSLAAHASQGENIFFLRMGKERFGELMGMETFVRVRDTTGAAVPENDLFAGLR